MPRTQILCVNAKMYVMMEDTYPIFGGSNSTDTPFDNSPSQSQPSSAGDAGSSLWRFVRSTTSWPIFRSVGSISLV